jgi:hypothetical protein
MYSGQMNLKFWMQWSCTTSHHLSGMERDKTGSRCKDLSEKKRNEARRVTAPTFSRAAYCGCAAVACGAGCATDGNSLRGAI